MVNTIDLIGLWMIYDTKKVHNAYDLLMRCHRVIHVCIFIHVVPNILQRRSVYTCSTNIFHAYGGSNNCLSWNINSPVS